MRGVSDLARMTPAAVEEKYGVPPQPLPRARRDRRRDLRQPARRARASGQGFAAKWINQYDGLDNVIAHADEITGKKGEALREHLGDVIRNRQLNALVRDLDLRVAPGRPGAAAVGPRTRCTRSSTASSSGCCATGSSRRSTAEEPRSTTRLRRSTARVLGAGERRRLARRARVRRARGSASHVARALGRPAPASVTALALAAADGGRRLGRRRPRSTPTTTTALAGLARRPGAAQGAARRQGPDARAGRARAGRCAGSTATPRCRRTSSGPTSAPTTWPTSPLRYLKRELRAGGRRRPASSAFDGSTATPAPRGPRCCTPARSLDLADGARRRARGARRHPAARRRRAAAGRRARRDGADRHRGRRRPPRVAGGALRRPR